MTCPKCGAEIEDGATACPECGASLGGPTKLLGKQVAARVVLGVGVSVLALLFLGVIPMIGVAAIALMWLAPTAMPRRLKIALTVILALSIASLPVLTLISVAAG